MIFGCHNMTALHLLPFLNLTIYLQQLAIPLRPDAHLFDDVRNQDTFALLYKNRAIFPNQRKNSFRAEQNHERIEVAVVLFHLTLKLEQVGHKILAINDGNGLVHHILHLDFVLVGDGKINGLNGLRNVKFAAHARLIDAVPIVNAVGSVACLLDFGHHRPSHSSILHAKYCSSSL